MDTGTVPWLDTVNLRAWRDYVLSFNIRAEMYKVRIYYIERDRPDQLDKGLREKSDLQRVKPRAITHLAL